MKIFSGSANIPLAEKIANKLSLSLSPVDIHTFPDGEKRIRITDSVINEDTIIIQSAATPVDENYMELFFIADALKRNGARSISAIVPYFGYQRQDHLFRKGEAVSLEVVIKIIETLGVIRFVSVDLHSVKIPELFHIPVMNLSPLPLFVHVIQKNNLNTKQTILLSPDKGGLRGIQQFSALLDDQDYLVCNKKRDIKTGTVFYDDIDQLPLSNKTRAIILDDMISSGSTILPIAEILKKRGISEIYVFATHPVFSKNAHSILQMSIVRKFFVTDTVYIAEEKKFGKLEILSVSDIIAKEIQNSKGKSQNYK